MAYASSEEQYESICKEFNDVAPRQVYDYFKNNWAEIKNEWVLHYKAQSGSFLNSTNNRLECLNGKLKQVICRNSSLEDFIENFFVILFTLRCERDHKASISFQKVKAKNFGVGTTEYQYSKLLTSYASSFVAKQLKLVNSVTELDQVDQSGVYQAKTTTVITINDCECLFCKSMLLPCRHILALRRMLGMSQFVA